MLSDVEISQLEQQKFTILNGGNGAYKILEKAINLSLHKKDKMYYILVSFSNDLFDNFLVSSGSFSDILKSLEPIVSLDLLCIQNKFLGSKLPNLFLKETIHHLNNINNITVLYKK